MFARLLMFAFIVSFVSCASHKNQNPAPNADRISKMDQPATNKRI
jgi:hypothetical protein